MAIGLHGLRVPRLTQWQRRNNTFASEGNAHFGGEPTGVMFYVPALILLAHRGHRFAEGLKQSSFDKLVQHRGWDTLLKGCTVYGGGVYSNHRQVAK